MEDVDLAGEHGGSVAGALAGAESRVCMISFHSDWLFPTSESRPGWSTR